MRRNKILLLIVLSIFCLLLLFFTKFQVVSKNQPVPQVLDKSPISVIGPDPEISTVLTTSTSTLSTQNASEVNSTPSTSLSSQSMPTTTVYKAPIMPSLPTPKNLTVMAWIYPSEPGCNAQKEYRDGRNIDVLKPEFFTVNGGELMLYDDSNSECNGYSTSFVSDLKKYSKQIFVTVSSSNVEDMNIFLANALDTGDEIDTLVSFVKNNNLDGIELDFEDFARWDSATYVNFKKFVTILGNALHKENKKLMIDAPTIADSNEQTWFSWRYEDFVNLPVDTIVVMAYDYQFDNGTGSPIAPLDWIKKVTAWASARFPKERLTIGVPSYGYEGSIKRHSYIRTYDQLKNKNGFNEAKRDEGSGERTWQNGNTVYYYQDAESLRLKIKVIQETGINSISIWHLGGNQWF